MGNLNRNQNKIIAYCAKPKYGGWVSFTGHLLNSIGIKQLSKISPSNRTEDKLRDYGYGLKYQNIAKDAINIFPTFILALDKHHYDYVFNSINPKLNNKIVIHDNIEVMNKEYAKKLKEMNFKIITIRKEISDYISANSDVESKFLLHPFYTFPQVRIDYMNNGAISVCRVDFDKHQEIMCKANKMVDDQTKRIKIHGAINRIFEYHKLKDLGFNDYYQGSFDKNYNDLSILLCGKKLMVDLTAIKNDGGGTQYTFLEAIYHGCTLVLNRKWLDGFTDCDFKEGYNCLAIGDEKELADILNKQDELDLNNINNNAKKLLQRHIDVIPEWEKEIKN